jgi:site-specific DNA recombinase
MPASRRQPLLQLGYARVSTDEQEGALQAQIARLETAGCQPIVSELISGRNNERPGLLEVIALVKAGRVSELVVTRVDRLGRDAAYADQLIALCSIHEVTIRALDGGQIETATPQGFFMARTLTTISEMESRMLSMRIRKQFAVYREQGRHLRRRKPFGYMAGDDHHLVPHPDHWPLALRILDELRQHASFTKVAFDLPAWCPWTPAAGNLQSWFLNPVIRGHIGHGHSGGKGWGTTWGQILYDQHPPLISESEWQALADHLRRTRNRFSGHPTIEARHGLTGLLRCLSCGHRLRRNTSQGTAWWRCRHRLCTNRAGAKEDDLLPIVVKACIEAADRLAAAATLPPDEDPLIAAKRRDLDQLMQLAQRNPLLSDAVASLEAEIQSMVRRERPAPDLEPYRRMMQNPVFFTEATAEEQRLIFGAVLHEVRVGPGGRPVEPVPRNF